MFSTIGTEIELDGYQIADIIHDGLRTQVYRGQRLGDRLPVAIKVLKNEYPTIGELVRFRNQFAIAQTLNFPEVVRAYSLEPLGNRLALVMEDFGGISLIEYVRRQGQKMPSKDSTEASNPLPILQFLPIAIQLADILQKLYQHRVIHKDIKPANVLIHPATRTIKLIDFSIATLLPREAPTLRSPHVLEGTLGYISPEQTGRMNRGVDYRTDFYSLGVMFYQLLCGQLPFQGSDPMELVHAHIAKMPPALEHYQDGIPQVLSNIVMKLMAKNAEDRYQSALGLKFDLEKCWQQWQVAGTIENFLLGKQDICDRFAIPEKLYGREYEVAQLLVAFDRVLGNRSQPQPAEEMGRRGETLFPKSAPHTPSPSSRELLLIAGFSGVGKTAVVNEVHKPIAQQQGYFIRGKFDQMERNVPLSAFIQAFRDLMEQLLAESSDRLQNWRQRILMALGNSAQVIVDAVPELASIIGPQPPAPQLSGSAAQNRFNLLFGQFISALTGSQRPLVIFLDDLQWADLASLQLLQWLMQQKIEGLLPMGAYRDNEAKGAHPLMLALEEIEKSGTAVNTITLAPLKQADLNRLVADTLKCSRQRAQPLAKLAFQKTGGNPFFARQFLKSLYQEGLIAFVPPSSTSDLGREESGRWQCDLTRIKEVAFTDDVVAFMVRQLQKLPAATQEVLKLAACVGNEFDLETLAIICKTSPEIADQRCWAAIQEGLLLPQRDAYKFYAEDEQPPLLGNQSLAIAYKFLHDRVQQAAYSLIPEARKQKTHLEIGRRLLRETPTQKQETEIFAIVNQFNQGIALITQAAERNELARLNLRSGQKAKKSTAYTAAVRYLNTGIALLPADCWQTHYALTLMLYEEVAEAEYLNGNWSATTTLIETVLTHAKTRLDRVGTYELQIQLKMAQNQSGQAIEIGLQVLESMGVRLAAVPDTPGWGVLLPELDTVDNLPEMVDAEQLAALRLLIAIASPAYNAQPEMLPSIILTQVNFCGSSGYSAPAAFSYAFYGLLMCAMTGELEVGYRGGQVALKLLERFDASPWRCKVYNLFNAFIRLWKEPLKATLAPLLEGLQSGLATGDLEYVGYSAISYCLYLFAIGKPLDTVERQQGKYLDLMLQVKQDYPIQFIQIARQLTLNLADVGDDPWDLVGSSFDERAVLPSLQSSNNQTLLCFFYTSKTLLFYLFYKPEQALESATLAASYSGAAVGGGLFALQNFYHSLALLANYNGVEPEEQERFLQHVSTNQKQMEHWAHHAPANYQHRYYLVEAERHRVLGQKLEALELYDRAIASAGENGCVQDEAVAGELAAQFYLAWGKPKIAQAYFSDAYYAYSRWGSLAKGKALEERYGKYLPASLLQDRSSWSANSTLLNATTHTISSSESGAVLDLATVMKSAQALAGEIRLDRLLSTLMTVAIENAGADMGVLFLYEGEQLKIASQASFDPDETNALQIACASSVPLHSNSDIPLTLINYVERTAKTLVLDDATTEAKFASDPAILERQPQSVLCTPLRDRGRLIGILYLENKGIAGAFTHDRVELLQILAAQAAIALDNARLYQQLEHYSQTLEAKVNERTEELQGEIVERRQVEVALGERLQLAALSGDIWSALTRSSTLEDILNDCAIALVTYNDAAFARIWTLDAATNELVLQASAGLYTHLDGSHSRIRVGEFKIGLIAQERQPHLTNDVLNDPRVSDKDWAKREGMIAFAGYPLVLENRLIGVMAIFARHPLTKVALQRMETIATEIALAIDRKRSEQALRKSESKLREQTQELQQALTTVQQTQAQLIQTEKMSGLGQMVAGIAHEINNPINFIYGNVVHARRYVQELLELIDTYELEYPAPTAAICEQREDIDLDFLREDLPKLLSSMRTGSDRIRNIILSLRNFSRHDEAEMKAVDLHEGIENTLLILHHRLSGEGDVRSGTLRERSAIAITKDWGTLPTVTCYPSHLNQVFMNIISNAIDALEDLLHCSPKDWTPTISIRTEIIANPLANFSSNAAAKTWVAIRIADNGMGIDGEVLPKIFNPFFTTKAIGNGTGLGLSISYQIVTDKHGGQLRCLSAPGQGTEFIIEIPVSPSSRRL